MRRHIGLVVLLTTFILHGQNLASVEQAVEGPADFSRISYAEAIEQIQKEEIKNVRPEYITNLVNQLRSGKLDNAKTVLVIYLLGQFHPSDINSIEYLIENIAMQGPAIEPKTRIRGWGKYPAAEALIKIGKPAADPILDHLLVETNRLHERLLCNVLINIEGKNGMNFNETAGRRIVADQIKKKLAQELDPAKKANLAGALIELDKKL